MDDFIYIWTSQLFFNKNGKKNFELYFGITITMIKCLKFT